MKKDSKETKQRILKAVGELLSEKGFGSIGINSIARKAGISKVLIYRYFGGLSQLLTKFAEQSGFWPSNKELTGQDLHNVPDMDPVEFGITYYKNHLRELLNRPETQEIMRWELVNRNELTDALYKIRHEQTTKIFDMMPKEYHESPALDTKALTAIIHAGISYLVLRSKTADYYADVDLHSEEGWDRIENAIETLIKSIFFYARSQNGE